MELVASARLRRAQTRIEAMRPYAETMRELIAGVGRASASVRGLPLLQQREEVKTVAVVALTGDRGLAGPFNAQIIRRAFALERQLRGEGKQVQFIAVGKKGRSTLAFRGYEVLGEYTGFTDRPAYADAQAIAHRVGELYIEGEIDSAVLVYNAFVSPLVQTVTEQELLPISADILETDEEERRDDAMRGDFIFEPEPEEILARLLPGLPRDAGLPRAARVGRVGAGGADDGDAERVQERRRADRHADAADEPSPPGGDHAGDPRDRRRRRSAHVVVNPGLTLLTGGPTRIGAMEPVEVGRADDGPEEVQERFSRAIDVATRLLDNIETVVYGKREELKLVVAALMCGGHVLLEDVPGTAKTVLARAIGGSIDGVTISRIQCTPDLQPTDVTGMSVFDQKTRDFEFRPGPIFTNVLLVDEINRATPKTQSALLEAMAEGQVTVDGVTMQLPSPFLLLATENPIEYEGTFPLPEAQLDRFLLRTALGYPGVLEERRILEEQRFGHPLARSRAGRSGWRMSRSCAKPRNTSTSTRFCTTGSSTSSVRPASSTSSRSAARSAAASPSSVSRAPGRSSTAATTSSPTTSSGSSSPCSFTGSSSGRASSWRRGRPGGHARSSSSASGASRSLRGRGPTADGLLLTFAPGS